MWYRIVFAAALMLVVPILAAESQSPISPAPSQVVTTATGEATVIPDRATITFAVETRAATAAIAATENARRQRAVIDAIHAKGIAAADVKSAGYSVTTDDRYDSGQRKVVGYIARNSVLVDVSKVDQIGGLIDAALSAGANLVSGLRFYSSKFEEVRRVALEQAVMKARADAEVMAKAAGGSLGNALEIVTNDAGSPRPVMYEAAMQMRASAGPETPIAVGEEKVSVTVTIRWQFIVAR
jgi:uncharacterized protein